MVEESRLRRLEELAQFAESELPPLPPADAQGNRPALEYMRRRSHGILSKSGGRWA